MPYSKKLDHNDKIKKPPPTSRFVGKTQFGTALRLWQRIFVVCSIVLALAYLSFLWGRQTDIAKLHEGSERRLALLSATLFAPIDKFSFLPAVTASFPIVSLALRSENDEAILDKANNFLNTLNANAKSAVIYLLNKEGVVIASSNSQERDSFVGKNYAFRPYFKQAVEHGTGKFFGMGTTSLLPGYYLSNAVVDGKEILGVVVVKIDMSSFDTGWKLSDHMAVTDSNGIIFLSSIADWKYHPLHALRPDTLSQIKRTRQYENALKDALDTEVLKYLGAGEQLVKIRLPSDVNSREAATTYFTKSEKLPGSDWTVNVFVPIDDIDSRARITAVIAVSAMAFIGILYLYFRQVRANSIDRETSRQALEAAHATLEQRHHELQTVSEQLQITAATDPLTGAFNRRYFFDATEKLILSQRSTDASLSLIMIDIDHFKQINDKYGHPAGDQVLRELTDLTRNLLRDADLFVRFGGEEFVIALPNASATDAMTIAERLCAQVSSTTFDPQGIALSVTISCGVAQHRTSERSIEAAIKRADTALYAAKAQGRNRVIAGEL